MKTPIILLGPTPPGGSVIPITGDILGDLRSVQLRSVVGPAVVIETSADGIVWVDAPLPKTISSGFLRLTRTDTSGAATVISAALPDPPGLMPVFGVIGDVLAKTGHGDFVTGWVTRGFVPPGGTTGQILTKTGTGHFLTGWTTPPTAAAPVVHPPVLGTPLSRPILRVDKFSTRIIEDFVSIQFDFDGQEAQMFTALRFELSLYQGVISSIGLKKSRQLSADFMESGYTFVSDSYETTITFNEPQYMPAGPYQIIVNFSTPQTFLLYETPTTVFVGALILTRLDGTTLTGQNIALDIYGPLAPSFPIVDQPGGHHILPVRATPSEDIYPAEGHVEIISPASGVPRLRFHNGLAWFSLNFTAE